MAKRQALTLDEAKAKCRQGGHVYADWYGKGWCMVWHGATDEFYDRNPVTGSLLLHKKDDRDNVPWYEGQQPKELRYED